MGETRREKERSEERRVSMKEWAQSQDKGNDSAVNLPEGYEYLKLKAGVHELDFMPFLAGHGNPEADYGFEYCKRLYLLHWLPMPNGKNAPFCALEMFAKFNPRLVSPITQWVNANGGSADPKLLSAIKAKKRHLWLVNDKPGDEKNRLKIYDTNDWNRGVGFRELMVDAVNEREENEWFYSLKNGMTAVITVKHQPGGDGYSAYDGVTRISFKPRKYEYPDKMLKTNLCLDDLFLPVMGQELKRKIDVQRTEGKRISEILKGFSDKDWRSCYEELRSKGPGAAEMGEDDEPNAPSSQGTSAPDDDEDDRKKASADDSDLEPAPAPKKAVKEPKVVDDLEADEVKDEIIVGSLVTHPKHGKHCEILQMDKKGNVKLETPTGEEPVVKIADCKLEKKEETKSVTKKEAKSLADLDDDDDFDAPPSKPVAKKGVLPDDDDDLDDDDLVPAASNGKAKATVTGKAAAKAAELDDDLDD